MNELAYRVDFAGPGEIKACIEVRREVEVVAINQEVIQYVVAAWLRSSHGEAPCRLDETMRYVAYLDEGSLQQALDYAHQLTVVVSKAMVSRTDYRGKANLIINGINVAPSAPAQATP